MNRPVALDFDALRWPHPCPERTAWELAPAGFWRGSVAAFVRMRTQSLVQGQICGNPRRYSDVFCIVDMLLHPRRRSGIPEQKIGQLYVWHPLRATQFIEYRHVRQGVPENAFRAARAAQCTQWREVRNTAVGIIDRDRSPDGPRWRRRPSGRPVRCAASNFTAKDGYGAIGAYAGSGMASKRFKQTLRRIFVNRP
jgi:hypothetical protein